jgi:hypothetical protein
MAEAFKAKGPRAPAAKRLASQPQMLYRPSGAGVVELVDTQDLGSCGESRGGSSPSARTRVFKCHQLSVEIIRPWR